MEKDLREGRKEENDETQDFISNSLDRGTINQSEDEPDRSQQSQCTEKGHRRRASAPHPRRESMINMGPV
jgi:hypothetical protein